MVKRGCWPIAINDLQCGRTGHSGPPPWLVVRGGVGLATATRQRVIRTVEMYVLHRRPRPGVAGSRSRR